jgi:DNA-binding beta-propeller fold protein YncE
LVRQMSFDGSLFGIHSPEEAELKAFYSPTGIDIQASGSMYDIYVADDEESFCVRKLSISQSEIAENSASLRVSPRILTSCKPSGLALSPDGQRAIVSCPEVGEIYKIDFSNHETVRIAGDSNASKVEGYLDGIGSLATFRNPQGVIVSPDGAFALIAE